MLTAQQIDALRDQSMQLLDPIVEFLIKDITERVSTAGQLTGTAAYEVWKAQNLGLSQRKLKKELQKRLKISQAQAEKLLRQAAKTGYNFDLSQLPSSQAIPFAANSSLQQIIAAAVKQAKDDLTNITRTMGFAGSDGKVRGLTQAYQQACDHAFMKTATGAQDYVSAVREATQGLAEKGVVCIEHNSGRTYTVEAATRLNIMGGMGIMQEQISQQNHDALECDGWELSAHAASAPDHEPYQGKQYSDEEYTKLNNMLRRRIGTLNCGHAAFPIILGVNSPQYTEEELEKFRQDNETGVTIDGKHYTGYQATQKQRAFERAIRDRKRRILIDEGLGDTEQLQTDQIKLVRLQEEYKRFSKAADLPMQHARMEAAGFTANHGRAAEGASRLETKKSILLANQEYQANTLSNKQAGAINSTKDSEPVPVSNTPQKPEAFEKGCVDVTQEWLESATPNSHEIKNVTVFEQDGVVYRVDGTNVKLAPDEHEKEIAELLKSKLGGDLRLMPKVSGKFSGVQTPDYLFRGQRYDLKTMDSSTSKRAVYNALKQKQEQADNFILDITNNPLGRQEIIRQIKEDLFCNRSTRGTKVIILVEDGDIVNIFRRKK